MLFINCWPCESFGHLVSYRKERASFVPAGVPSQRAHNPRLEKGIASVLIECTNTVQYLAGLILVVFSD